MPISLVDHIVAMLRDQRSTFMAIADTCDRWAQTGICPLDADQLAGLRPMPEGVRLAGCGRGLRSGG